MFSKILVAYDGSDLAKKALQMAMKLSQENPDLGVEIVHVYQIPTVAIGEGVYTPSAQAAMNYLENAQKVLAEAEELVAGTIKNFNVTLKEGNIARNLLDHANETGCDFILIGSRGLSGIKEYFLGSVSHNVVQKSNVPVLIVK
ncbi:universal stress protein UspA-like protein [Schinkia azotoformans MEV2011]|uniref:Universal stress protein UspA-like protein n=1 Tax=Schinkia azotoformans MEV2011 TaxID=1348973 RepID=A0A072P0P8_SCHAZ|nr:universal stress protein [Schinkia azotoformans]KEF39070.1 universal stress protein UspA-like protein [Schinkia azotoformans MEV2011]MEC1696472.1 universal stress protein [Schinkia azotoformans]MEC1726312.1 universal stress protein [Schinkia azotoformans]MEC1781162.1 universal stress protein [Schinkia azotoformans]MED4331251.1 universal stress protein [Schinkia azotoformans]